MHSSEEPRLAASRWLWSLPNGRRPVERHRRHSLCQRAGIPRLEYPGPPAITIDGKQISAGPG